MKRTIPGETKLVVCVKHRFTLWSVPPELPAAVQRRWPEMKVVHLREYDRLAEELRDANIFAGYSLRAEQLAGARKLRWIHSTAAGVSQLMYPELRASGVVVTNASGVHAVPIAEHLLGALTALARQFPAAVRYQLDRRWAQQELWDGPQRPRELAGQVLLIIGFGAIGRELARRVRPLGMNIHAVTRSGKADSELADCVFPASRLLDALPEADFVVLAAPETPETRRMISAAQLAAMKPSAFLVNIARGTLVDETALIAALERHTIAGVALDVAEQEPLPPESPLWGLDNVFLTPHLSGVSEQLWTPQTQLLLENLERWFDGRDLINRVDFERGY